MEEIIYTVKVNNYKTRRWYLNNNLHRANGPAIEGFESFVREWYLNGNLHRANKPAIEHSNGDKYWYLNDKQYDSNNKIFKILSNSICFRPDSQINSR